MTATKAELEAALAESDAKIESLEEELKTAPRLDGSNIPTVYEAWNRVMRDVQFISKNSRNEQQRFNFRGIDAVMNAVGPVLREHGVIVVPNGVRHDSERYTTAKGGQMCNRTVEMGFEVFGPAGDSFKGYAFGEAADAGDKAITKAESVALRTFLLQALMLPTDDPDPDGDSHERATPATAARAQPPAPVGNADSAAARGKLRELATSKNWDLNGIANKFAEHNKGRELKDATAEEVTAFTNLLETGAVTV
ncbi:ERF family ssDNA binding protein [Mycobacterium phage Tourach]|uniref:ERF family ssDNA binding protein n=1 Tax=Mycobacterium phage Tourach TaxID=2599882 RepID=A0A5J6TU15_9CAUD|nr:ERF family ssDNA binding protein [Mycobacterium phage Tourach]QFG14300.1 ERF family ssDNA binding protein [Mycobacterium phage Tourach]